MKDDLTEDMSETEVFKVLDMIKKRKKNTEHFNLGRGTVVAWAEQRFYMAMNWFRVGRLGKGKHLPLWPKHKDKNYDSVR